jgi:hypothetical protein
MYYFQSAEYDEIEHKCYDTEPYTSVIILMCM